jgi:hypothetical protein
MRNVVAAVSRVIGRDELALLVGLVLMTVSLWSLVGLVALLAPGVVITWLALPSRLPLVHRPLDPETRRKR